MANSLMMFDCLGYSLDHPNRVAAESLLVGAAGAVAKAAVIEADHIAAQRRQALELAVVHGAVATFSKAPGAMEIALHEMGHTAFGFADEYEYYAGCGIDVGHDHHPGTEPSQPNVTINPNRGTIKWGSLILPTTPVPTTQTYSPETAVIEVQCSSGG